MMTVTEDLIARSFPGCPKGYDLKKVYVPGAWRELLFSEKWPAIKGQSLMFMGAPVFSHDSRGVAFEFEPSVDRSIPYSDFHREELQKIVAKIRHGIAQLNKEIDDIFGGVVK